MPNPICWCSISPINFYFDSRFGCEVDEDRLHDSYKLCKNIKAKPVLKVCDISLVGYLFVVRVMLTNGTFEVTTVSYDRETKCFRCQNYDPRVVIQAILQDPIAAQALQHDEHPFYDPNFVADYSKSLVDDELDFDVLYEIDAENQMEPSTPDIDDEPDADDGLYEPEPNEPEPRLTLFDGLEPIDLLRGPAVEPRADNLLII